MVVLLMTIHADLMVCGHLQLSIDFNSSVTKLRYQDAGRHLNHWKELLQEYHSSFQKITVILISVKYSTRTWPHRPSPQKWCVVPHTTISISLTIHTVLPESVCSNFTSGSFKGTVTHKATKSSSSQKGIETRVTCGMSVAVDYQPSINTPTDICSTSLFSMSWFCISCGREICNECKDDMNKVCPMLNISGSS